MLFHNQCKTFLTLDTKDASQSTQMLASQSTQTSSTVDTKVGFHDRHKNRGGALWNLEVLNLAVIGQNKDPLKTEKSCLEKSKVHSSGVQQVLLGFKMMSFWKLRSQSFRVLSKGAIVN